MKKLAHTHYPPSETEPLRARDAGKGKRPFAIAAATGGPTALQVVLSGLPADLDAGGVIVLHSAQGFTAPLAARLDELSPLSVVEAHNNAEIRPGTVLVAPTGLHLTVKQRQEKFIARLITDPSDVLHRPSADVLFESIAGCCAADTCGIILTGMGNDGALGLRAIRQNGGYTIAQDETTSIIYGMPRRAVELGGVDISLNDRSFCGRSTARKKTPPKNIFEGGQL